MWVASSAKRGSPAPSTSGSTHNHGSSMKDDLHGLTVGYGVLARQVDDIEDRLTTHLNERRDP